MANTLLLKRQSTASAAPTTGQLALGELAVNSRDGTLFLKRNDGTTDQIVKVWTDRQLTNTSQLTNDSNFLTSTQATTTIGSGITGPIFLNISNPGVGNASGFNFLKANDGAGLSVTEYSGDSTLYEFFMSDNPDGPDAFSWRYTDWQGTNGLWNPLFIGSRNVKFLASSLELNGILDQPFSAWYTTRSTTAANAAQNIAAYNTPGFLRVGGSGTISVTTLDVSGYTATSGAVFSIRFISATQFEWGYGSMGFTAQQTVDLVAGPILLSNGIYITFSGTTGALTGDQFQCRVWKIVSNYLLTTTMKGNILPDGSNTRTSGTSSRYWSNTFSRIFTSDAPTGTAPLSIASTTLVSNLNADLLDGQHASSFQPTLVSGTNIKTVNGISVLGTGDINTSAASAYEKRIFDAPTNGQTVFTISGGYPANKIEFFRNGAKLVAGLDYDATSGTSITLVGFSANQQDVYEAYWFDSITPSTQVQVRDGGTDSGFTVDTYPGEVWHMKVGNSLRLPATPAVGNFVKMHKSSGFSMTVLRNGSNIMGLAEDLTVNVYSAVQIEFVYVSATYGWAVN